MFPLVVKIAIEVGWLSKCGKKAVKAGEKKEEKKEVKEEKK